MRRTLIVLALAGLFGAFVATDAQACHKKKCAPACPPAPCVVEAPVCPPPAPVCEPAPCAPKKCHFKLPKFKLPSLCHKKPACEPAPVACEAAPAPVYAAAQSAPVYAAPQVTASGQ